jgi:hypothetical protein
MGENEIDSMMKDLDKIYQELQEEKECKIIFFNIILI